MGLGWTGREWVLAQNASMRAVRGNSSSPKGPVLPRVKERAPDEARRWAGLARLPQHPEEEGLQPRAAQSDREMEMGNRHR